MFFTTFLAIVPELLLEFLPFEWAFFGLGGFYFDFGDFRLRVYFLSLPFYFINSCFVYWIFDNNIFAHPYATVSDGHSKSHSFFSFPK